MSDHEPIAARPHEVSRPPLIVTRDDAAYQADARREADFWASSEHAFGIEAASPTAPLDAVGRYSNRRLTGDPKRRWYEEIARYGPFRRGLALGASGIDVPDVDVIGGQRQHGRWRS